MCLCNIMHRKIHSISTDVHIKETLAAIPLHAQFYRTHAIIYTTRYINMVQIVAVLSETSKFAAFQGIEKTIYFLND